MTEDLLSPSLLLSLVTAAAGGIGWLVAWSIRQDRRIQERATSADLEALRAAVADMGRLVGAAQSRETCGEHRQRMSDAIAEERRRLDVLVERLDSIKQAQDEIRSMVRSLYDHAGLTPWPGPAPTGPITRQPTGGGRR